MLLNDTRKDEVLDTLGRGRRSGRSAIAPSVLIAREPKVDFEADGPVRSHGVTL